jgi:hypothetical protein
MRSFVCNGRPSIFFVSHSEQLPLKPLAPPQAHLRCNKLDTGVYEFAFWREAGSCDLAEYDISFYLVNSTSTLVKAPAGPSVLVIFTFLKPAAPAL